MIFPPFGMYMKGVGAVVIGLVLAAAGFKLYSLGVEHEEARWKVEQDKLQAQHREKQDQLQAERNQLEVNYENLVIEKNADVASAHTELDKLRRVLAQRRQAQGSAGCAASPASAPRPTVDEAPTEGELFGSCAAALTELAGEADALRLQLIGLQGLVNIYVGANHND